MYLDIKRYINPIPYVIGFYAMLTPLNALGFASNFSYAVSLLLVILVAFYCIARRKWIRISKPIKALAFFFVFQLFSLLWTGADASLMFNKLLRMSFLVFAIALPVYNKLDKTVLTIGFFASALIMVYMALNNLFLIDIITGRAYLEVGGQDLDQNYLSFLLLPAVAFSISLIGENKHYVLWGIGAAIIAGVIYTTLMMGTRGGTFCVIFTVGTYILKQYKISSRTIVFMGASVLILYLLLPFFLSFLPDIVANRFSAEHIQSDNAGGRVDIWDDVLNSFFDSPVSYIFGFGVGNTAAVSKMATHNYPLQILIECGILGVILYLRFVLQLFKSLWKQNNALVFSLFSATTLLSMTLAVNTCYEYWLATGICLGLLGDEKNKIYDKDKAGSKK